MIWAWLAIVMGALIIATRLPLVLRPIETLRTWRKVLGTDGRVRVLSAVYVGLVGACLLGAQQAAALEADAAPASILLIFGVICAGGAVWTLAAPASFRRMVSMILGGLEESRAIARGAGILGVLVGALLLSVGVRAL